MGWFKSRGKKLEGETDSLLKKAEKEIGKAKEVEDLQATIVRLTEQATKIGKMTIDIITHSGKMGSVQLKLAQIAAEVKEMLAAEQPGRSIARMRVLGARARKLKQGEAELLAKLAEFKKEGLRIEALEEQQNRLQEMIDKATRKSDEILNKMMEDVTAMADQTSLIFDEAMGNMFEKP